MHIMESEWLYTAELGEIVYVQVYAQHLRLYFAQLLYLLKLALNAGSHLPRYRILNYAQNRAHDE